MVLRNYCHTFVLASLGCSVSQAFLSPRQSRARPDYSSWNLATPDWADDDENTLRRLPRELFENSRPLFPPAGKDPPSKGDFYSDEELGNLLELHRQLLGVTQQSRDEQPEDLIPSLHHLVVQAAKNIDKGKESECVTYDWLTEEIRQKALKITAIASDVDGTLLRSNYTIHPRTKQAVQRAIQSAFSPLGKLKTFFPATGKTRWGCLNSLGPEVASLVSQCPGVFIQGLYCVLGDKVIFEKKLSASAVEAAERLAAQYSTSIIAYDGDNLYTTDLTPAVQDLHSKWGEPLSKEIPSISSHGPGIHKILIMDYDLDKLAEIRPQLESLAKESDASVTQAIPSMLELIPAGCSKALGVEKMCEALGINPSSELLAVGDAENDVEMLKLAAIGVAVGNGGALARQAADIVLRETNDEGGAGLAIEVLGGV